MEAAKKQRTFADIINDNKSVLVDFSAEWCGPCKMMKPILEELKAKIGDKATILKVDVDQSPEAARFYQIQSVPTLLLFKNGKLRWRQTGVVPIRQLEDIINRNS